MNLARSVVISSVLFLLTICLARALDPTHRISQYGHTAWRIQDGYFAGQALSITQTTDGYLWVGTEAGLLQIRWRPVRSLGFAIWRAVAVQQYPYPAWREGRKPMDRNGVWFGPLGKPSARSGT